jgi:hypothetical protein
MKARYIGSGDPEDVVKSVEYLGVTFQTGEWVDLPEDVSTSKIATHPHFESASDVLDAEYVETVDDARLVASTGDWKSLDKTELEALAQSQGIVLDKRRKLAGMQEDYELALMERDEEAAKQDAFVQEYGADATA